MQTIVGTAYTIKEVGEFIEKWMRARQHIPEKFNVEVVKGIDWFDITISYEVNR